ncbi:MAG: crotonase/enoyl-CoA hydratase family protein [Parvibaculales bacterium]
MSEFASYKIEDGIAVITMNDGKANALGFGMQEELNAALDAAEEQADVIVLTAEGRAMSAGFDLKVMQNEPDRAGEMVANGGRLLNRIFSCPKPVIIASPGHGIAAGGLLMLTADYRIGAEGDARYGLNESAIGMVLPDFGYDLAQFKLNNKYLDMCFVGAELIDSATAVKAGFLDETVPADKLHDTAMEKAKAMQQLHGKAYAGNKRLVRGALTDKMTADLAAADSMSVSV